VILLKRFGLPDIELFNSMASTLKIYFPRQPVKNEIPQASRSPTHGKDRNSVGILMIHWRKIIRRKEMAVKWEKLMLA